MDAVSSRRNFLKSVAGVGAGLAAVGRTSSAQAPADAGMAGFKTPPMQTVRVGFIGVGARGSGHVGSLLAIEGVAVTAICDTHAPALQNAVNRVTKTGAPAPKAYGNGPEDYRRMLEQEDIDIVLISTPWEDHTRMCVDAMKAGKHAFTEVPATVNLEESWQLVDTSEKTRKHCMMLENCCYGREELMVLNLCRQGILGDLLHGEAAYIHDLRGQMNEVARGTGSWRTWHYVKRNGNLYPTHGLGPVAQYMGINRGDRFDAMSSFSSPALGRPLFAKQKFPPDHQWNQVKEWKCGDMNTSIIHTARGRTIMLQWDETSPRPYTRHNLIQGTLGTFAGYPGRLVAQGKTPNTHDWVEGDGLKTWYEKYDHPLWTARGEEGKAKGGHGGMDFIMLWRMIYCLRNGEPLDQDVYDAASWSAVGPLSELSVARNGQAVEVPDFTRGRWKTTPPLGIVS